MFPFDRVFHQIDIFVIFAFFRLQARDLFFESLLLQLELIILAHQDAQRAVKRVRSLIHESRLVGLCTL